MMIPIILAKTVTLIVKIVMRVYLLIVFHAIRVLTSIILNAFLIVQLDYIMIPKIIHAIIVMIHA